MNPGDFKHGQGVRYDWHGPTGYLSIEVLTFLNGHPWDEVALAFVHSLRPSSVRVISENEGETADARTWRVTIYLKDADCIKYIRQEVEVSLPEGVAHGSALRDALRHGLTSEQVKWHQDAESYIYDGINGRMYKITTGKMVEYPHHNKEQKNDE